MSRHPANRQWPHGGEPAVSAAAGQPSAAGRPAQRRAAGLRPHEVRVQALAVARLVAATARADGRDPDHWQVMEALQRWAVRLPHGERLRRLRDLGERTDDLWLCSALHQAGAW